MGAAGAFMFWEVFLKSFSETDRVFSDAILWHLFHFTIDTWSSSTEPSVGPWENGSNAWSFLYVFRLTHVRGLTSCRSVVDLLPCVAFCSSIGWGPGHGTLCFWEDSQPETYPGVFFSPQLLAVGCSREFFSQSARGPDHSHVTLVFLVYFRKLVMSYGMLSKKFPTSTLLEAQTSQLETPLKPTVFCFFGKFRTKNLFWKGDFFGGWVFGDSPPSTFPWLRHVNLGGLGCRGIWISPIFQNGSLVAMSLSCLIFVCENSETDSERNSGYLSRFLFGFVNFMIRDWEKKGPKMDNTSFIVWKKHVFPFPSKTCSWFKFDVGTRWHRT